MKTYIYKYASDGSTTVIGNVSDDGIVYNDPDSNFSDYAVGHIDFEGTIYNAPFLSGADYAIGHVDASGVIYNAPYTEIDHAIGHVSNDNHIYSEPYSEVNCLIGKFDGTPCYAAAAALLLMKNELNRPTAYTNQYNRSSSSSSGKSFSARAAEFDTNLYCDWAKFKFMLKEKKTIAKELKSEKPLEEKGIRYRRYACPKCKGTMKIEFVPGVWNIECRECDSELKIRMSENKSEEEVVVTKDRYRKPPAYLYYTCPDCGSITEHSYEEGTWEANCPTCHVVYRFEMNAKCKNTRAEKAARVLKKDFICDDCKENNTIYFHTTRKSYCPICKKCHRLNYIRLDDYEVEVFIPKTLITRDKLKRVYP